MVFPASFELNQAILRALSLADSNLAAIGLTLIEAALIVVVTYIVARLASALSRRATHGAHWDVQLVLLVGRIFYVAVLAVGLLALLYVVAPNLVAPLLGAVALLGLAFGLAFQDILRNWLSGFFLLIERPFRIGDDISVANFAGTVEDVELRTTVLRTSEGRKILVPNQLVFTSPLVNNTYYPLRATQTAVRIPPDRDPSDMLKEARSELSRVDGVAKEPQSTVAFAPRGDADTALVVRYWIDYLHHDADAVEREVSARMVFVVAGANINANDVAVTRAATFLRPPPQSYKESPREPTKVRTRAGMIRSRLRKQPEEEQAKKPE
ncbi:MAG: mechanosensitive ion channel family protein [Candidatus Dormibacteraeota bacterium]|nr:mechanosensitive ion channel family protein [Candidatus Dormibacteraeota bacterium]